GLRIKTLGNYEGGDGLRVKDLPELVVRDGGVEFERVPTIVMVRRYLSKAGHQYF
ncbi:MAG: site-specific integrase, partial [Nitrososphaeria archaeon]|nr:site-specific integrase [Nitrososphaeria archaeon]